MFGATEKAEDRFIKILEQRNKGGGAMFIFADTETGVQYLFASIGGDATGFTVLMDETGKPLINEKFKKKKE